MLFEEVLLLEGSDPVLSTLSLVQVRPWRTGTRGSQGLGDKEPEAGGQPEGLALTPFCGSPVWACLSGVSFFLPEMAEFWCPPWPTGLQHEDHVS